jgi:RNA polymerase sigma-70 factor, ECF subfamily
MSRGRLDWEGLSQPVNQNFAPWVDFKTRDAAALERALVTDRQQAFQRIVDDHYEPLLCYAHFLLGRNGPVEDVVHQAFLLAFDRLAGGQPFQGDPGKWLRGTVRNLIRDVWRQQRKLPQDIADQLQQVVLQADEAGEALDRSMVREALRRCLDGLNTADRDLIGQHYVGGSRITEIAERLELNAATLRVRLFRIRQDLKACVEAQFAGEVPT